MFNVWQKASSDGEAPVWRNPFIVIISGLTLTQNDNICKAQRSFSKNCQVIVTGNDIKQMEPLRDTMD